MKIEYVNKKEVQEYKLEMQTALIKCARELTKAKLPSFAQGIVGSAKRNLVLKNKSNPKEVYDVDYQLTCHKKETNANHREVIRKRLLNILNKDKKANWKIENSTSVLTAKKYNLNNELLKSFDLALIKMNKEKSKVRSTFNKKENKYIWNEIKDSKDLSQKIKRVEGPQDWQSLRNKYKNYREEQWNTEKDNKKPSISIFVQVVNEVINEK